MAVRETITISITPELRRFICERLRSGYYGNAGEVVRAGPHLLIEHDQGVRRPVVSPNEISPAL